MKPEIKRAICILLALIVGVFVCMSYAHAIQTGGGTVAVSKGILETEVGDLTYKLYVPEIATEETPAPGVLLLHGYQNDHETCAAYAIELARRALWCWRWMSTVTAAAKRVFLTVATSIIV